MMVREVSEGSWYSRYDLMFRWVGDRQSSNGEWLVG